MRLRDSLDVWLDETVKDLAQRTEPTITITTAQLSTLILELQRARLVNHLFIVARREEEEELAGGILD